MDDKICGEQNFPEKLIRKIVSEEISACRMGLGEEVPQEEVLQKIKELESDLLLCKQQMIQTLHAINEKFSEELNRLMSEQKDSIYDSVKSLFHQNNTQ